MKQKARFGVVAAVIILALGLAVSLGFQGGRTTGPDQARRIPGPKHSDSTNWSGYAIESNLSSPAAKVVTDVRGSWFVPPVTSSPSGYSSVWVGIDGYASSTVEQVGTEQDSSGSYYAWYEMYPRSSHYIHQVYPGDAISAEVLYQGNNFYRLTITDSTTDHAFSYSTRQKVNAQRMSAEWVVEAPSSFGGVLPLANFGTAKITNAQATLGGVTGSISDPPNPTWQYDPMTMVTASGVKALPSVLSADGSSFSVAWVPAGP
jgi:Peptidase A4 family